MSMTAQEIFNKVYKHLLTQMEQARQNTFCRYRAVSPKTGKTIACAVGCLVPDDQYKPEMEDIGAYSNIFLESPGQKLPYVPPIFYEIKEHRELLTALQKVHDSDPPSFWKENLARVANTFELEIPQDETLCS